MNFISKVEYKDIREWIPIKDIKDNSICLKSGGKLKLYRIEPINFNLKSESEKINILESYKRFLKNCNFDMQIIIQTDEVDLEKHITNIEYFKEIKPDLSDMVDDYINLIKDISKKRESISRKFYIVTSKSVEAKIKSGLEASGNLVSECSNSEIINVFKRYFKKSEKNRKELRWV